MTPPAETDPGGWWREAQQALIELLGERDCSYVYDLPTIAAQARRVAGMRALARKFYAVKANPHPEILRTIAAEGLAFECVSRGEVERVFDAVPGIARERLLFTPNFAARADYAWAVASGLRLTVDNLYILRHWADLFRDTQIIVRFDTGHGHGHHEKVRTAGMHSKFGVPLFELDELRDAAARAGAKITGLHAHTGSGNFAVASWVETAMTLAEAARHFSAVGVLNIGGGLGVVDQPQQQALDLPALDAALEQFLDAHTGLELWLEPGRYLVAAGGVLLARVTQLKGKGEVQYVGVTTGMNSLLRPALYGSYHEIVNLTRLDEPPEMRCTVVGPICESGDVLGEDRLLPRTVEGDILLVANAGAYGHVMSSHYNLRAPAEELLFRSR